MNKEKALQNLKDAVSCLEKNGLRYFLIDGTLLGAIREGGFIEHDTDIDLGVFMKEWTIDNLAIVFRDMMKAGFILYHSFGIFGKHFELAWFRDGIKVDFFFYYEVGDKIRFNAFLNGGRTLPEDILTYEYDRKNFKDLSSKVLLGEYFYCPNNPIEVLEAKYGPDWRTPVKRWDWAHGPENLIYCYKCTRCGKEFSIKHFVDKESAVCNECFKFITESKNVQEYNERKL